MKKRPVKFKPTARADLALIEGWLAEKAGASISRGYSRRIIAFCQRLEFGSERGTMRDDISDGLRVIGFEKRVNILFLVSSEQVTVLRIFYGGRNWEAELDDVS